LVTVLKGEIKAVVAILEEADDVAERALADNADPPDMEYVATRIIEALDEYRSQKPLYVNVAVFSHDGGANWHLALQGPHKSRAVAKQKSAGLFPPGSALNMRWLTMGVTKDFRKEVLEHFKKPEKSSAWRKDSIPHELIREVQFMEPITPEEE
jgi:hypothetical protein